MLISINSERKYTVNLTRCPQRPSDRLVSLDVFASGFRHNMIIKLGHGVGTAVCERWRLVLRVRGDTIHTETTYDVLVDYVHAAAFLYLDSLNWSQEGLEIGNEVKRDRMLLLLTAKFQCALVLIERVWILRLLGTELPAQGNGRSSACLYSKGWRQELHPCTLFLHLVLWHTRALMFFIHVK